MKLNRLLVISVMTFFGSSTWATTMMGPGSGNGGNSVGLDFTQTAEAAIAEVKSQPKLYPELKYTELVERLNETKVIATTEPLFVLVNGVRQPTVAKNLRRPDRIFVNIDDWNSIASIAKKKAIALHELLGLLEIESSGDYRISRRMEKNPLTEQEIRGLQGKYAFDILQDQNISAHVYAFLARELYHGSSTSVKAELMDDRFLVVEGCEPRNCGPNRAMIVFDSKQPGSLMIVRKQEDRQDPKKESTVFLNDWSWRYLLEKDPNAFPQLRAKIKDF